MKKHEKQVFVLVQTLDEPRVWTYSSLKKMLEDTENPLELSREWYYKLLKANNMMFPVKYKDFYIFYEVVKSGGKPVEGAEFL